MPVRNLVSDFGGVGDGQRQTVTITVTSASSTLTVGTGIFTSGDVGKMISIWSGNSVKNGTISGFTSSTVVTLNGAVGFTATGASADILWGTNNLSAFVGASGSWRAFARAETNPADPPILEIPDGYYAALFSASSGGGINDGVLNSPTIRSVSGNADDCTIATFNFGEIRFGHNPAISQRGLTDGSGNSARLQTTSAGATSAILVDPTTYGSRMITGRACLLAAFDLQSQLNGGFGYPPNSYFYEWNVITGYDSGSGAVSFQTPLTQTYKSTYPEWDAGSGSAADQGGPFTIWVCPDGYNNTITLENFTIDSPHNQTATHVRHVVCNGIVNTGAGMYPTLCDTFTGTDCTYVSNLEVDKMVGTVTWNNCTHTKIQQQSASPSRMVINGGTMTILETAKYTEANNVAFTGTAQVTLGVNGYGRTDRVILNGCTGIAVIARGGTQTSDLFGSTGPGSQGNASDFFTWSGGVLTFAKALNDGAGGIPGNVGQQNPTRSFVPGTWVFFDDKYLDQVTDVYEDGTTCFIQFANTTDWPFTPVLRLKNHPCPDLTRRNCTGTALALEDWNQAPARIPAYSYSNRTYVADATGTTAKTGPVLLGRLNNIKYTVTTPYVAGALTFKESQFNNWRFRKSDFSTYSMQNDINMVTSGLRTLRALTTPTGTGTGDSLPDLTSVGPLWVSAESPQPLPIFSANVTNGETPTINVEITLDQGIPSAVPTAVAPLRLRLRAA